MRFPTITKAAVKAFIPRFLFCILGNFFIGLGVAATKLAVFGIDPFNGSCFAVSAVIGIPYVLYAQLYNLFLFIFEIIFGRKYVGVGTFINWFLVSFAVTFSLRMFGDALAASVAESMVLRIVFLVCGLLVCSLGIAIYQLCNAGVAPYDALPIMVCDRLKKLPFFWSRMIFDGFSVGLIFLFHGEFGVGTILTAFCLGPVIHFFTFLIKRFLPKKA